MNFRLLKTSALALASIAGLIAVSAAPASASPTAVTFKFDNMGGNTFNSTGQDASSYQISNYMTNVLHTAGYTTSSVTVTGGIGEQGADSYAGDNHNVGPVFDTQPGSGVTNTVFPLTLANTEGLTVPSNTANWDANPPVLSNSNPDGFIKNCSQYTSIDPNAASSTSTTGCRTISGTQSSPDIFMNFGALKIVSFSFDFEIFPDATCTALNVTQSDRTCGTPTGSSGLALNPNLPDLEIWTGDNKTGVNLANFWGVAPGAGTTCDSTSGNANDNPTYTKSGGGQTDSSGNPIETNPVTETAPQIICHATISSAAILAATGSAYLSTVDFMDWPETIGIDNLKVYIPEPGSFALFGFGILGLVMFARRKHLTNRA